ncbi:MAG: hypothetical protein ACYC9Y_06015 [Candidatus Methylomirabilia bacterium]
MILKLAAVLGATFAGLLAAVSPLHATDLVSCAGSPELLGSTAGGRSDDLTRAAFSGDGRYVAFASKAANLAPGDENGSYDVYVRDLQSGTSRRTSHGIDGGDSDGDSSQPALSADGRFVVFASSATNLVAGDTNARTDVFRKDLLGGTVVRISTRGSGAQVYGDSSEPVASADGRYVAFTSTATDLVGGEPDGFFDVFVKDVQTGQTLCASAPAAGGHGGYSSRAPSISADGRFVAFESSAWNLIPGFTPTVWPVVYVKDLLTGTVTVASAGSTGEAGNGEAEAPTISADGRFVAFESFATNLAPGCVGEQKKIYVKDLSTGGVRCVSVDAAGVEGNSGSYRPSTPDGRHVVFESRATNLMNGYLYARTHVYVKDLHTGAVSRASSDSAGNQALDHSTQAAISADARFVAFVSVDHDLVAEDRNGVADVFVKDLETGALSLASPRDPAVTLTPSGNGDSSSSKFCASRDGRFVIFGSRATDIVADDTNGVGDVFVRDRAAGTTVRVSTAADGSQADAMTGGGAISGDGRYAAFASFATNLVGGDVNATNDVFVKDLLTGEVVLASTSGAGAQGNGMSGMFGGPSLSGDGRYVAFTSLADNLVDGDTNGVADVFVKDLQSGAIVRASTGSGGEEAANSSAAAAISADGRFVAFESKANNLVAGDTGAYDVFVKNLQTGALDRVSTSGSGAQADGSSAAPAISADGRFVAFQSTATNLVAGDTGGKCDIFVKDRQTGLTQRASTSGSGAQGIADSVAPSLSDDGRYVVFESGALNLTAGIVYMGGNIFLKDLQTQEIVRMSAGRGAEEPARSSLAAISGDGRHVVFASTAENLVRADGNLLEDVFHVARQADLRIGASGTALATAGKPESFWISLRNEGPCLPQEVVVSAEVPEGTTFVKAWADRPGWSVSAPPVGGRGTIRFTRASVPLGDTHELTILVSVDPGVPAGSPVTCTAHAASATEDPSPENLASWTSTVETAADLEVILAAPAEVAPDDPLAYDFTVTNLGPGDASDVVVGAALPAGVVVTGFVQVSGPVFDVTAGAATIVALPAGATAGFRVTTRVDAGLDDGTALIGSVQALSSTGDPTPAAGNHLSQATTIVRRRQAADLDVLLGAPAAVVAGSELALQVTITNRGPDDARDVVITTAFPDGVSPGTPAQAAGPAFSLSTTGREAVAGIPLLQAGAAATFVFGGSVAPGQPEGALLRSTVVAVSATPAPVPGAGNRAATAETRIETQSDLSVTLAASASFTGCRGLAYTVTVVNRGPSDARQVELTHDLPAGFEIAYFAQTSGPPFTLAGSGGTLTAGAAVLPAGATAFFSVGSDRNRTLADGVELTSAAVLATETAEVPSGTNGHLATATTVVGFVNEPPLADAGGPYRLLFGAELALDGSGSVEPDAGCGDAIASWEWDLDGDGEFGDAVGATAGLTWAQVQALICGGNCESGRSYTLGLRVTDDRGVQEVADAQVQVILPVFSDDFFDAGPTGDPQWDVASGRWLGTEGQLVALESTVSRALVRLPLKVGAGVVETSVWLPSSRFRSLPNGGVIFAWLGKTRYRYARLDAKGVSIVQVGRVGSQGAGTWKSARTLARDQWHTLRVEIAPDGWVDVFVDGEATPAVSRRFRKTPLGRIGLWANRSRSSFGPFTLWPPAALPWPGR